MKSGRRQDVLLRFAEQGRDDLLQIYVDHGDESGIPEHAQYLVKRLAEDLRSALDWLATDLWRALGSPGKRSPYYPICATEENFQTVIQRDFPRLHVSIVDAMRERQPFRSENASLGDLPELANANKHRGFSSQRREEGRHVQVLVGGMGLFSMGPEGMTLGAAPAPAVAAGETIATIDPSGTGLLVTPAHSWQFDDGASVISTFRDLFDVVSETVREVSDALDNIGP